jgi:hypothetical protein
MQILFLSKFSSISFPNFNKNRSTLNRYYTKIKLLSHSFKIGAKMTNKTEFLKKVNDRKNDIFGISFGLFRELQ